MMRAPERLYFALSPGITAAAGDGYDVGVKRGIQKPAAYFPVPRMKSKSQPSSACRIVS
jgi:hypothetical protein